MAGQGVLESPGWGGGKQSGRRRSGRAERVAEFGKGQGGLECIGVFGGVGAGALGMSGDSWGKKAEVSGIGQDWMGGIRALWRQQGKKLRTGGIRPFWGIQRGLGEGSRGFWDRAVGIGGLWGVGAEACGMCQDAWEERAEDSGIGVSGALVGGEGGAEASG